uniref:DUF1134 domain-containing protein n=1 Tax=Desulfovibrio sp. U5L TaxID=596152 RepID=I2PXG5_9BACT
MKRLVAFALAGWCVLAASGPAKAQGLKERSLSDTPAAPAPAPAPAPGAAPAPAQAMQYSPAAAAASQPGAATVSPAPTPAQPAYEPAPATPLAGSAQPSGAQPSPAAPPPGSQPGTPPAYPPSGTPPYQPPAYQPGGTPPSPQGATPPPSAGGTPINGQTAVTPPPPPPPPPPSREATYNRDEVNREVMGFFESGSRGLAQMVARSFHDLGQPTGFIKGNEAGGALVVGLRYGTGTLNIKGRPPVAVYWQSPSLGFDLGVNAVKVFTLVYGTTDPNQIFQRFPAVDGSAYIIGGFGMNYQRSGDITLAPIRFGVGLRLGANIGYQHYTRTQEINPF